MGWKKRRGVGRRTGVGRRDFLKLGGGVVLSAVASTFVGFDGLQRLVRRQTPAGQVSHGEGEVILETGLDSEGALDNFHSVAHPEHIAIEPNPAGPGNVMSVYASEGDFNGARGRFILSEAGYDDPEAMYAQYYLYFPEDATIGRGTKLPGFGGFYGEGGAGCDPVSGGSWSSRGYAGEASSSDLFHMDYYVYHADHVKGDYTCGEHFSWDGEYAVGEWHEVTQYVEMNTPGEYDGTLQAWMNGEQVYNKQDFQFRDADHPNIGVERYYCPLVYWGGSWGAPVDQRVYFRDLTLSTAQPAMGDDAPDDAEPDSGSGPDSDPDSDSDPNPDTDSDQGSIGMPC